jgi:hypothetical protein
MDALTQLKLRSQSYPDRQTVTTPDDAERDDARLDLLTYWISLAIVLLSGLLFSAWMVFGANSPLSHKVAEAGSVGRYGGAQTATGIFFHPSGLIGFDDRSLFFSADWVEESTGNSHSG